MRKKTVKRLTRLAVIIVALGLIYAIAVAVSSAKLRRAYANLERAGRPMNRADVIPAKIPDAENAAPMYESAILLLNAQPAPEEDLLEYLGDLSKKFMEEDLPSDKQDELKQLVMQESVTLALSIVEQGTQRDSCRFDHDYDAGFYMLLPHLSDMRQLTRLLAAKGCLEARAGSLENAWDRVPTQLKLAEAMLDEPVIVSQLVYIRNFELACRTIRKLCEIAPPTEQQSKDIASLLKSFDSVRPLVRAIDSERLLFAEWVFDLPKSELLKEPDILDWPNDILGVFKTYFKPTFLADHAAYLRMMLEFAQRFELPYSHGQIQALEKMAETDVERYPLTRNLIPAMYRLKQIHCEMLAELRIVRTGLALLQYQHTKDSFPASLDALQLSDVTDPFSEDPLFYQSDADGFILYSVGPDQKDNGGSQKQKEQKEDWDIVWQYTSKG
ncbi:hypothetical protein ACFL5Z_17250 [Planctomycetota bacterium]